MAAEPSAFCQAIRAIDRAGAKLIVFDLLFTEPQPELPDTARDSARAAAARLTDPQDASLRAALDRVAADDPDADLAAAIHDSGKVLLPLAFSFNGKPEAEPPAYLSDQAYQTFDKSPVEPVFPPGTAIGFSADFAPRRGGGGTRARQYLL
jgi:hypothetical protein